MLSLPVLYALLLSFFFFFFNDTATTEIYTLSLHDALPIWPSDRRSRFVYSIPWLISTAIPKDATAVGRWSCRETGSRLCERLGDLSAGSCGLRTWTCQESMSTMSRRRSTARRLSSIRRG